MANDNWDFYPTQINDKIALVLLNLSLGAQLPQPDYPIRFAVFVQFENPRDDGMYEPGEGEVLCRIEDALVPAVMEAGAIFAGRVTTDGRRDFFFYAPSEAGLEEAVAQAMAPFDREFGLQADPDPEWSFYREILWPTDWDFNGMLNRRVLRNLEASGDDLAQPRRIHHWATFANRGNRASFVQAVRSLGFGTRSFEPEEPRAGRAFAVHFHRIDPVDDDSLDKLTWELRELARGHSGDYDGWETQVVQPGTQPNEDAPADDDGDPAPRA